MIGNRKTFRTSSNEGISITEIKNPDKKAIQEKLNKESHEEHTPHSCDVLLGVLHLAKHDEAFLL